MVFRRNSMPIPIGLVGKPKDKERYKDNLFVDYSFLFDKKNVKEASDSLFYLTDGDAKDLMKIWLKSKKVDGDFFMLNGDLLLSDDIIRLKTRGLITGDVNRLSFTPKAKRVIKTMTLGEANKFLQNKKEKSYTEILASMDKKGKRGYRNAFCVFDEYSHLLNIK